MNSEPIQLLAAIASLAGALFFLASGVGMLRLPDFYTRIHAPAKAATLGLLFIAAGSTMVHLERGLGNWLEDLLLIIFVFMTVPVGNQMLLRGAAARGVPSIPETRGEAPDEPIERVEE